MKNGKTKETVIDQGRLRRHNDQVKCGILNNIWELKKSHLVVIKETK